MSKTRNQPFQDPYLYPGTATLKNWFNERDPKALRECETLFSGLRIKEVIDSPDLVDKKMTLGPDFETMKKLHAYIFQDIYPSWGGETRSIAIGKAEKTLGGKSVVYAAPGDSDMAIGGKSRELFNKLKNQEYFTGLDKAEFANKMTGFMSEMWQIHPFREGNTRVTMAICYQVSVNAGHALSLTFIDKMAKQLRTALVKSSLGSTKNLQKIISSSIDYEYTHEQRYSYEDSSIKLSFFLLVSSIIAMFVSSAND
ncbi:MAG: hypothetical protein GY820_35490 [Gammaproteobacteria bacterium]|nr:hypothetical protein [Gammaproteobacteria bacterium]